LFFVYLFIVCTLSSQSSWSLSGITIAGNSAGNVGSDLLHLNIPIGLYYDVTNNNIIVGDSGNYRVIKFSLNNPASSGTVIAGSNGVGCALNQFSNTIGVAFDSSGQLYVSDSSCNRIMKYPPSSSSSTSGTLIGSINTVEGLFLNQLTGDLYVAGNANDAVYKFPSGSMTPVVVAGT
jgi:hypothetical protein